MPNYTGNKRIAEYGALTRFGQSGGCVPQYARQIASDPWSMRGAVRRIGYSQGYSSEPATLESVMRVLPAGYATAIDYVAAALFVSALNGNVAAMKRLERIIDG